MVRLLKILQSSPLLLRILSGIVLISLSLYLIYRGPPLAFILVVLTMAGLFYEWTRLLFKAQLPLLGKVIYAFAGTSYLCLAIFWIVQQISLPEGWKLIYWLLFLVWSTDISAFVGGKILKGPKLAPSISPHKTWSGFMVGMFCGTIVAYITSRWLIPGLFNIWGMAALVLVAQGGDLLESKAKRWSHVKDSGSFIPGHGGFLDRLDSLIAVLFILSLWQSLSS